MKCKFVEEDLDIGLIISNVMKKLKKEEDVILSKYGLTHFHSRYVVAINNHNLITMNELTEAIGVDKANTTRVVKDLLNSEVVEKSGGVRKFGLSLTNKGKQIAEEFKLKVTNFLKKVFKDFSELEVHNLKTLLEKMFLGIKNAIEV